MSVSHEWACISSFDSMVLLHSVLTLQLLAFLYYRLRMQRYLMPYLTCSCETRCRRRRQTFPPVPPPGELDETCALLILILPNRSNIWKHDVIHKTGNTVFVALPSEQDRATATGNMYKILLKFGRAVFDMGADRQRHADTLITILRTPTGVINGNS